MTTFDAELYLRLIGERELLHRAPNAGWGNRQLLEAARALLAVGAVGSDVAAEVAAGYGLAASLRDGRGLRVRATAAGPSFSAAPNRERRRTLGLNVTIERPTEVIRVRSVTLSETTTRLSVVISAPPGKRVGGRRRSPTHGQFNYRVVDDRGGQSSTSFGGGGNDREWRGQLTAGQPLAVDTAWIELDGTRIELPDSPRTYSAVVESLPSANEAHRFLWHWLAIGQRFGPPIEIDVMLSALVASGHLDAEDPVLDAARAVAGLRHPGRGIVAPPSSPPPEDAPEEWRSLLAPARGRSGAEGMITVSTSAPPFDGVVVTVETLNADAQGWDLEVDVTPGVTDHPMSLAIDRPRVAWWAVDDRGQHYLGHLGSYHGGPDHMSGTVEFGQPLERGATLLTLLPTGPTERARIEIPLEWGEQ